ncbi:hypothetical protein SBRCBS47491_001408 [Sporothrix bragantina]|uniref:Uncharacterized protein n=1 Tax=Sporothrix bragantina TaxID=671064 RepID=A0ABP0AYC9_9PEZI
MSSRISTFPESRSKTSLVSSTTRLASLDAEMRQQRQQQTSSHYPLPVEQQSKSVYGLDDMNASATEMYRRDSGYESTTPQDRQPRSPGTSNRRAGSTTPSRPGSRTRPPTRRAAKSGSSITRLPKTSKLSSRAPLIHNANAHPVTVTPSVYDYNSYHDSSPYDNNNNTHTSYFHFPSPDPQPVGDDILPHPSTHTHTHETHTHESFNDSYAYAADNNSTAIYQAPPQTTHYWTSDQTRRLEYAAIDAASRGFKGWVMRHVVPDCFVPKAKRRVTFDDDTGSVRRYRIELETEESTEKECVSTIIGRGFKKGSSNTWWS